MAEISPFLQFVIGGTSGISAILVVQPIDLIKTNMQLSGSSAKTIVTQIIQKQGVPGLYNGLSAAVLRQATYGTTRLGVYNSLTDFWQKKQNKKTISFFEKLIIGSTAGGIGAVVGNPSEVALIRMTSDSRLPEAERRNYKNVFDSLYQISKNEGILTLWRGATPTITRAIILNASQLATYSQFKEIFQKFSYLQKKNEIYTHFLSSLSAGFCATATSIPVDMAKTRLQAMKYTNGIPEYTGPTDVLKKVVAKEGFFALWRGFVPYFMKLGPHTVLTFISVSMV